MGNDRHQTQKLAKFKFQNKEHLFYTLEIPYNEIPCYKASLLRALHGSPQRADD